MCECEEVLTCVQSRLCGWEVFRVGSNHYAAFKCLSELAAVKWYRPHIQDFLEYSYPDTVEHKTEMVFESFLFYSSSMCDVCPPSFISL